MCASYGLDPRFSDKSGILADDADLLAELADWARDNDGETLRPTGKNRKNLNPILTPRGSDLELRPAWWGYLIRGEPARFTSHITRSEKVRATSGPVKPRALVPATSWFEMQKPQRVWHEMGLAELFLMAAVIQPGRYEDTEYTCYSILMQDSPGSVAPVHDRSPVLVPADFQAEWLTATAPAEELIAEAVARSTELLERVTATALASRP